jgi:hypothetical protein
VRRRVDLLLLRAVEGRGALGDALLGLAGGERRIDLDALLGDRGIALVAARKREAAEAGGDKYAGPFE